MPITFDMTVKFANTHAPDSSIFLHTGTGRISTSSALNVVSRISGGKAENQETVRTFLLDAERTLLSADPQTVQDLHAVLSRKLEHGEPLKAKDVHQVKTFVDLKNAQETGKAFVLHGQLPAGHATAFAQYCVAHNLPMQSRQDTKEALKSYILHQVVDTHAHLMSQVQGFGSKNAVLTKIVNSLAGQVKGENVFFAQVLDSMLETGQETDLNKFSFNDFSKSMTSVHQKMLNTLSSLSEEMLADLSENKIPKMKNMVKLLMLSAEKIPDPKIQQQILAFTVIGEYPLQTEEQRINAVRCFMLDYKSVDAALPCMTEKGMPSLAGAVARNPEVLRQATALLDEHPCKNVLPSFDQIQKAMSQAVESFIAKKEPLLRELVEITKNPPANMQPPLNQNTLPMYLNTLISGEAVLEPLLNETVPIDKAFFSKLMDYAQSLNTANHFVKGEFGADDIARLFNSSVKLLLNRSGVNETMYPEILGRTISKFGQLSCDLVTVQFAIENGLGKGSSVECLRDSMTLFRMLTGYASALLDLMPRSQLAEFGVANAKEPVTDKEFRADRERNADFFEKNFQRNGELENISMPVRQFILSYGIPLPPVTAESMQHTAANSMDRIHQTAFHAVNSLMKDILSDGNPANTTMTVGTSSRLFQNFFAEAAALHDLSGLSPHQINSAMSTELFDALMAFAADTANQGRIPTTVELREQAFKIIEKNLLEMKNALDQIDSYQENSAFLASRLTPENRQIMKDAVQRYGIVDTPYLIASFFRADSLSRSILSDLDKNPLTPAQLEKMISILAGTCITMNTPYLAHMPKGAEHGQDCLVDMALRLRGANQAQMENILKNITSPLAHTLADSIHFIQHEYKEMKPDNKEELSTMISVMNSVRIAASVLTTGNAAVNPQYYQHSDSSVKHLSDIPGGPNGYLGKLNAAAGRIIGNKAVNLGNIMPALTVAQWNALSGIYDVIESSSAADKDKAALYLVCGGAKDLLAALEANGGKLNPAQIWAALIDKPVPAHLTEKNIGVLLFQTWKQDLLAAHQAAVPNITEESFESIITAIGDLHLSPRKILEIARPGARLSLKDMPIEINLGVMRQGPETAYGMTTDFHRRGKESLMTFTRASGDTFIISPMGIPREQNTPEHPVLKKIVDSATVMTHSEAQKKHVMQMFTQSPLIIPRIYSVGFPGVSFSEHGNFSVTAQEQPDGSVVVDIASSDPGIPLSLEESFVIQTDGSYNCTKFEIFRPSV